VVVIDAGDRAGGVIASEYTSGYRVEGAANGFAGLTPPTLELVRRLDLEAKLEPSSDAARKRFLYRRGRLHLIPSSPGAFLTSPILSLRGRLRAAAEPFTPAAPEGGGDETVHDFFARRLGDEVARILVDAMVSGVFAGDSKNLSLQSTFPFLRQLEVEGGSLLRGLIRARRARRAEQNRLVEPRGRRAGVSAASSFGKLTSFREGMATLPEALAAALAGELKLATTAERIVGREGPGGGYRIMTTGRGWIETEAVVLAVPPRAAADLLQPLDPPLGEELAAIPSAPIAVVATGYPTEALPSPLDGFGFLVPRGEGLRMLGCLWDSSIFRFRAPVGRVLLRTMIGGAHDRDVMRFDDAELTGIVRHELAQVLGLTAEPELVRVIRHRSGIPQYVPGHGARLGRIDARLTAALPGVHLTGNGYRGVATNRLIEDSTAVARQVMEFVHKRS
jgi:oxygen-dependent protoporphyrinogen oxidase